MLTPHEKGYRFSLRVIAPLKKIPQQFFNGYVKAVTRKQQPSKGLGRIVNLTVAWKNVYTKSKTKKSRVLNAINTVNYVVCFPVLRDIWKAEVLEVSVCFAGQFLLNIEFKKSKIEFLLLFTGGHLVLGQIKESWEIEILLRRSIIFV